MTDLETELLARLDVDRERAVAFLQALLRAPSPNPPGDTRRVADPFVSRIVVKDGKWAAYEGAKAMR